MTELAVNGGDPTVTIDQLERWERPVDRHIEAVTNLIDAGELSGAGAGLPQSIEEDFAEYTGADYCLSIDHGSTALASAYYAVGVGPGDEIITPAAGYLGAYAGALHMGARPVFAEVDPDTLLVDPTAVEGHITDRTAAINLIHKQGRVCDMDAFLELRNRYDIPIVQDCAHAHGSEWRGEHVGSLPDIACFSLQGVSPNGKPIAAGEGGFVTTNDREYYERQLSYCHLHRRGITDELTMSPYDRLDRQVLGRKWRAHPLALAIAAIELESLPDRVAGRLAYRDALFEALEPVAGLRPVTPYEHSDTDGMYGGLRVVYDPSALDGLSVERFVEAVRAEGVPMSGPSIGHLEHRRSITTEGYDLWGKGRGPLGDAWCGLPPFEGYEPGEFPITEELDDRVLRIDSFIDPAPGAIEQIVGAIEQVADAAAEMRRR